MMKTVYICSPLGGDIAANLEKAKRYMRYALDCGTAPVVPHFYALCLDDANMEESGAQSSVAVRRAMGVRGRNHGGDGGRNPFVQKPQYPRAVCI